jgi:long-chain acyl-CoA synthetase
MSAYDDRPWLDLYAGGMPAEIAVEHDTMLGAFAATVARDAGKTALQYFDTAISFGELDQISDALATGLAADGFQRGDRLAVYLQNMPQFVIAMLATWKAGGIMVSVSPMLKHKELTALLQDSGASAVITLESLWAEVARDVVPNSDVRTVVTTSELDYLDRLPAPLAGARRTRPADAVDLVELVERHRGAAQADPGIGPEDIAFLTYTSGTTGPSKGAMNSHANVMFNAQAYRDWIGLTDDDVAFGAAPFFHVTGLIGNLAAPLLIGMPIVMSYRFDPDTALELIERHRTTFTAASITAFIALMNADTARDHDLSSLRKIVSGGAPIAPATVEAYERQFGAYVHNIYGSPRRPRRRIAFRSEPARRSTPARARCRSAFRSSRRSSASSTSGATTSSRARSASSSPRDLRSSRATGRSPTRPNTRFPAAPSTPATSASWTSTAGSTSSTARRT